MRQATSITDELQRLRLEHRAARIDLVTRELRRRSAGHPAAHLIGRAIEGFESELVVVQRRLRKHSEPRD